MIVGLDDVNKSQNVVHSVYAPLSIGKLTISMLLFVFVFGSELSHWFGHFAASLIIFYLELNIFKHRSKFVLTGEYVLLNFLTLHCQMMKMSNTSPFFVSPLVVFRKKNYGCSGRRAWNIAMTHGDEHHWSANRAAQREFKNLSCTIRFESSERKSRVARLPWGCIES